MSARHKGVLDLAWLLDVSLGDPPNRYHPVAWMGAAIGAASRRAPAEGRWAQLVCGAGLVLGGGLAMFVLGRVLEWLFQRLPAPLAWLAEAWLLKTTFSMAGLARAAQEVEAALSVADLREARRLLRWHLVSRDTSALSAVQVAAATIESVAENSSDGVVAPLLYYSIGGLPAALAYRFINTADAMLGYRDPGHEWLGKVPARLDDVANLLPARASAGLIVLAALLGGERGGRAWQIWLRDAGKTESPNAGHPMSAMAGALDVELEKVGHYRLGSGGRAPAAADIGRAVRLVRLAVGLLLGWLALAPAPDRSFPIPSRRDPGGKGPRRGSELKPPQGRHETWQMTIGPGPRGQR
jgi:adenosylcobinamide-phosphate synthase